MERTLPAPRVRRSRVAVASRRPPWPAALAAFMILTVVASAGTIETAQPPDGAVPLPRRPAHGNRGAMQIALAPGGRFAGATEADEGTVALIDTETCQVVAHLPSGGEGPDGLAYTPDGRLLVVANGMSGSVAVLQLPGGAIKARIPMRGMPASVVVSPDGHTAYVSLRQLDAVAVIDLAAGKEAARIPVGRRPRALALTRDGSTLLCANQSEGTLSLIDTSARKERKRVELGGVNARALAVHPDGKSVYATVQPPLNFQPASYPIDVWHNFVREVTLDGANSSLGEEQWMDFGHVGSPDEEAIAISPDGHFAYLAVGGRHTVAQITLRETRRSAIWPLSFRETMVGPNPRGLALSADGRRLWVANRLGNSVSLVDTPTMSVIRTIDLGPASRVDPALYGKFLFSSAHLSRDGRFSCNTCHPDGAADGLTWQFTHVPDGLDRRNTRDLRGGIAETPPYRWTGYDASLDEFMQSEVTGLMHGPRLDPGDVAALRMALGAFRLPPNPYRREDGELTPAAGRGQQLFDGKAGCAACHAGPRLGGTGRKAWVGTTTPGLLLDVPHLSGAYDSAPYLHDGSAATLDEIFTRRNPGKHHGNAAALTPAELGDVLEYVREQ